VDDFSRLGAPFVDGATYLLDGAWDTEGFGGGGPESEDGGDTFRDGLLDFLEKAGTTGGDGVGSFEGGDVVLGGTAVDHVGDPYARSIEADLGEGPVEETARGAGKDFTEGFLIGTWGFTEE
jgi:hypothetical protein